MTAALCAVSRSLPLRHHLCCAQLLQAIDGVEIVIVCNRSDESSQRVATEFNIPRIASNWSVTDGLTACSLLGPV